MSCVDAARERMRHIYDTFDTVCIQFSGGKDSTAILYLAKEIHEERNLGPVKVIFRDEEMLSPTIVKFVGAPIESPSAALAGAASNTGKKAKDSVTINAASKRRCLIWVLLPHLSFVVCFVLF
jgi:asparagine synthetase B (glutamine-hydrolysing)